ncbi:MAG TPA: TldD/PmbA family protein [Candidatus Polarisedimenticolaceae bacterium]|nr:TldD/PmbA family protein [Candidatus Polarisedimenticolaceae bacterium]
MIVPVDSATVSWRDALRSAIDPDRTGGRSIQLFLEHREHVRIDFVPGAAPVALRTRISGLTAHDALEYRRQVFRSAPIPEDAAAVAALAAGDRPRGSIADATSQAPTFPSATRIHETRVIEAMERMARVATAASPAVRLVGRAVASRQHVMIARPDGTDCEETRLSTRVRMMASQRRGPHLATAVVEAALHHRATEFRGETLDRLARALVERVERRLDARELPGGRHAVVLAPGVGGILVHEIVGHALEADAEHGWLAHAESPVAPPGVDVIDDPRAGRAAWRVDDEGVPSRATPLIRDGRVVGRLHDRLTALRDGVPPTGHGRRSSYREPVMPRMGCTFIASGPRDPDELVRDVGTGVYVRRMEAAHVDSGSGRAIFRVTDADRIVAGRVCAPLDPFVMVLDGREVLASLTDVGHDLRFDSCIGSCHREGQSLSMTVGAPTICIGVVGVVG